MKRAPPNGKTAARSGLPAKPTPAQRKAAEALALTPAQQKERWSTTSTSSPRLQAVHAELDRAIRTRFPDAAPAFEYNMQGWTIPRGGPRIEQWTGTMDPNWIRIFLAERKQGITVHVWNPFDPRALGKHKLLLENAGYKVMVGCVQYNRKGAVPLEALTPIFEAMAGARRRL